MAFLPYSYDSGQMPPSEYLKASGDITVGLCMKLTNGALTASATPDYIALCDMPGASAALIPAMHISPDVVFEAPLAAAAASLKPGGLANVSSDGLSIGAASSGGTIQIISMDGTAKGDKCRCRFVG